jgi:hypothetical protein
MVCLHIHLFAKFGDRYSIVEKTNKKDHTIQAFKGQYKICSRIWDAK